MDERENIIEEVKRRIESIRKAKNSIDYQINREALGALSELDDLLEWLEQ